MSSIPRKNRGYMMLVVILVMMVLALTILLSQAGMITVIKGKRFTETENSLTKISNSLVQFVANYHRLPCPANPGLASDATDAGFPDQDPIVTNAHSSCNYKTGVVPWRALGLKAEEVQDEWGRLISYRVYDGAIGLTQAEGASMINCDTSNSTGVVINETPPSSADGSCNIDHNTLDTSFINSTAFATPGGRKGYSVNDFDTIIANVAFVLISHGPSGLGGYLSSGSQVTPLPSSTAADYPNIQAAPAAFIRAAASDSSISPGTAGHYDDVVSYLKITDLAKLANVSARDWPDTLSFNAATTSNMTSPGTDHFLSSGTTASGQAFTQTDSTGTAVQVGAGTGAFSACLWAPNLIHLINGASRNRLTAIVDFAANSVSGDRFVGFTVGFLSGSDLAGPPTNGTCGQGIVTEGLVSSRPNATTITVDAAIAAAVDPITIGSFLEVYGSQISSTTKVQSVSGTSVSLNNNVPSSIAGTTVTFADPLTRQDEGWAGGTLGNYGDRFAVEFDGRSDPAANDPTNPHLAVDFKGVVHDGATAESCASYGSGLSCDSPPSNVSKSGVSRTSGTNTLTGVNTSGLLIGMSATGTGIGSGAVISSISGTTVTLSVNSTSTGSGTVTFSVPNASTFMIDGLTTFNHERIELRPNDCIATTGVGSAGASTVTVTSSNLVQSGMAVYGSGLTYGTTVTGISGSTISLSSVNSSGVSGKLVFGESSTPSATATGGSAGSPIVTVSNSKGIAVGMVISGTGIASGTTVQSISGTTLTLSANNIGNVSGSLTFTPNQLLNRMMVKAWTLSNSGCTASAPLCSALQDINSAFTTDITNNRQFLHVISCIPAPATSTAYNSLYFGLTTANRSISGTANNLILQNLKATTTQLP